MTEIIRPKKAVRNRSDSVVNNLDRGIFKKPKSKNNEGWLLRIYPPDPGVMETIEKYFPTIEARDDAQDVWRIRGFRTRRIG